jgi:predicted nucleic acid-binding protein
MVLIDSSVWIEGLRRQGRLDVKVALEAILEAYEAQVCAPARLEVMGGARKEERRKMGFYFSVIPYRSVQPEDWERAIALAWRLRDYGITVPWLDVLIASIALHDQNRLYTIDAHFEKISEVTGLLLYRPGYGGSFQPDNI